VKAVGRDGFKVKLGWHQKDKRFLTSSTSPVTIDESNISDTDSDLMDIHLKMDAQKCQLRDVISFTVIVIETKDGQEYERRGMTTIIHMG
ncbi:MAG: hypothetical protein ACREA1_05875, partial [Nitrosotalea sp.]